MDRKSGEGMGENRERLLKILEGLEGSLESRAVVALKRSPESFVEEARTLELVIDLRKKLNELAHA